MKPLLDIMKLNQVRYGTDFDADKAIEKLQEELQEFIDAEELQDTDGMIDSLGDTIVIAAGEITKLKYNPELVLKQIVKEITSRTQDPIQAQAWAAGNRQPGEKWKKDPNQDPETLYKADFSTCKFK